MREATIMFLLLALLLGFVAVTPLLVDQNQAVRSMQSAGYTDVQVLSRANYFVSFYGCGNDDTVYFEMRGKNLKGEPITNAYVCVGWPFKGATIRYR